MTQDAQRLPIGIEDEMKSSFMDYAMSVIISRALPDVRDGLKPVHRRILYAMLREGLHWNHRYIKCAGIVGEVLKKYHPHGDAAVYDALVRLAQGWNLRYPLVDGQGNFGSIEGDPPAAYRYTEARLQRIADEILADLDKETVDFGPNFDESDREPLVLPTQVPNLLVNGAAGIAVGMATNIPPHNLREVIDAAIALCHNPRLSLDELLAYIPGPDFPTAGIICGRAGIRQAYETGRGSILMRGRSLVEEHPKSGRQSIVVTEIPYQLNPSRLIEKIAELTREKRIDGVSDLRNESDRDGMRIVVELKKDAVAEVVLNQLYKLTPLQSSFGVILLAIVDGRPRVLSLREALWRFVEHRREVVARRSLFELRQARERAHILEGLKIALDHIDAIIDTIRASASPEQAKQALVGSFELSPVQAQAILEMRLQRLTGLERDKILKELAETLAEMARLEEILADEGTLMKVVVDELSAVRERYGDQRRTEIIDQQAEILTEDMIAEEDMVVTVTHSGYVKRNAISLYRAQKRGGRGVTGATTRDEDFVAQLFIASTHAHILMFTDQGRVYCKKVFELPEGGRAARGKALVNLLGLREGEKVVGMLPVRELSAGQFVVMATRRGVIKKTALDAFESATRASGLIALSIDDGDALVAVWCTRGDQDILLGTRGGLAIRFREEQVRAMGRVARGVKGIALRDGDAVVGMAVLERAGDGTLLTVCERGFGKRTPASDYPTTNRGGLGVITIKTTERNGKVVAVRPVTDDDDLMIITDAGKIIRMPVAGIPTIGRITQGVRLIRLDEGEQVVAVDRLADKEEAEGAAGEGEAASGRAVVAAMEEEPSAEPEFDAAEDVGATEETAPADAEEEVEEGEDGE